MKTRGNLAGGKAPLSDGFVSGHDFGFVSGHDFSRAANGARSTGALAPAGCIRSSKAFFRSLRTQLAAVVLCAASLPGAAQAAAGARPDGLPLPPAVEKELAAKASDVTEVTLGKNMLDFAAKFMKDKDEDTDQARKLIQGLKGIYVREYTFDKEGDYSMDQLQQLRAYFETSEWSPIVRERERKRGETTDVLVKTVNGETQGMFILTAEPKELTIVLILGPIRMEDLGELRGLGGLGVLGEVGKGAREKTKPKNKDGGTE